MTIRNTPVNNARAYRRTVCSPCVCGASPHPALSLVIEGGSLCRNASQCIVSPVCKPVVLLPSPHADVPFLPLAITVPPARPVQPFPPPHATCPPVKPCPPPDEPCPPPVKPCPPPVKPCPPPDEPCPPPVKPCPPPVEPCPPPVEPCPPPDEPCPPPVEPCPPPEEPDPLPVEPGPLPVEPDPLPVEPGPLPVEPDPEPCEPCPEPCPEPCEPCPEPCPEPCEPCPTPDEPLPGNPGECSDDACADFLCGIACIERAIANILNQHGALLSKVIATATSTNEIIEASRSVCEIVAKLTEFEALQVKKMSAVSCICGCKGDLLTPPEGLVGSL